MDKMWDRSRRS